MARTLKAGEEPSAGALTQKKFLSLTAELSKARQAVSDEQSELSALYKRAEEAGFNRAALKLALKLKGQDEAKTNDFLADLETYCHWLGVGAQAELFDDERAA